MVTTTVRRNTGEWQLRGNTAKKLCKQEQLSVQAYQMHYIKKLTGLPYIYLCEVFTDSLEVDLDI